MFDANTGSQFGVRLKWAGFDALVITRTGSMLAHLYENDLIEIGRDEDDSNSMLASSELVVHRAIYQNTSALAIVHVHPPHAVALSMLVKDAIIPIDSEGSYIFRKMPVVQTETTVGSKDAAKLAAEMLRDYRSSCCAAMVAFPLHRGLKKPINGAPAWKNLVEYIITPGASRLPKQP